MVPANDQVAIKKLVDGLKNNQPPVPAAEGIHWLSLLGAKNHSQTIEPYLDSQVKTERAAAIAALAMEPKSHERIVALAKSGDEDQYFRNLAIVALGNADPDFTGYAASLVEDKLLDDEIKVEIARLFVGRMNYHDVREEDARSVIKALEAASVGDSVDRASKAELKIAIGIIGKELGAKSNQPKGDGDIEK